MGGRDQEAKKSLEDWYCLAITGKKKEGRKERKKETNKQREKKGVSSKPNTAKKKESKKDYKKMGTKDAIIFRRYDYIPRKSRRKTLL
jgi:hypothetical protein